MKIIISKGYFIILFLVIGNVSCKKYLEAKTDQKLTTPQTISDLQLLLDDTWSLNRTTQLPDVLSDEYWVSQSVYDNHWNQIEKDAYIWRSDMENILDWEDQYKTVFVANTVLDNLSNISQAGKEQAWNTVRGTALIYRAHSFFQLCQLYAPAYKAATSPTALGIPIRLTSDFNIKSQRATLEESYKQIVEDINAAIMLLPKVPQYITRPSKPAAYALMARVKLTMGNYEAAALYADSCLSLFNKLTDYNSLPSVNDPFVRFSNEEVIWDMTNATPALLWNFQSQIDSNLVKLYEAGDLRKNVFLMENRDNTFSYKTSYSGSAYNLFTGLATDEIYLIRAESRIRTGNISGALDDVNALLSRRYEFAIYTPYSETSVTAITQRILEERRKELLFRSLRWMDIRRLNSENANISLSRKLGTDDFSLPANSPKSVLLIPLKVIRLAEIEQNGR